MKKLFSLLFAIICVVAFSSCGKDDNQENDSLTTYTLNFEADDFSESGVTVDVILYEFDNSSSEPIIGRYVQSAKTGLNEKFIASEKAVKIKVYVVQKGPSGTLANWMQQVFQLKDGTDTKITISNSTSLQNTEPS